MISGSGRSAEEGGGNSLQYSCLENSKDTGDWRTTVLGVTESDTTEQPTLSLFSLSIKQHLLLRTAVVSTGHYMPGALLNICVTYTFTIILNKKTQENHI